MDTTSKQYDTIPMNYGGILCCICIWLLAWVITPSLDELAKSVMDLVCIGMAFVLLGCLRHYRLDAHGFTQFYLGSKERQISWEDVAQIGVLYATTYAKGGTSSSFRRTANYLTRTSIITWTISAAMKRKSSNSQAIKPISR